MQTMIHKKLIRATETSYTHWALVLLLLVFSLVSPFRYSNADTTSEVISTTITNETVSTTEEITDTTSTSESEVIDTQVTTAGGIQTTTTTTEITTTTVDEVTTTTIVNQTTTTVTENTTEVVEEKSSTNYLTNPDFSSGTQGWTTSGAVSTGASRLDTGNQSSGGGTASQTVDLFDQMTQSEIQGGFDVKYGADVTSHGSNASVPACDSTSSQDCRDDFSITFTISDSLGNILHKFEHEYTGITFTGTQGFFFTETIDPNSYTSAFATLELFGIDRGFYSGTFGPAFDNAVIQTYWNVINFITEQITTQVTEQITNVVVEYVTTVEVTQEVTSEDVFVGDPVQDIIDTVGGGSDIIATPDAGPIDVAPDQGPDPEQPQEFTIEIQSPGGDPQTMTVEVRTDPEGEMTVEIKMDTQEPEQQQETQQEVARVDAEIEERMEQQEQQSEQNQDQQEPEQEQQSEQNQDQQEPEPEQQESEPEQQESEQKSETKTASKNDSKEEKSDSNETKADLKQKIAEAVITNIIEQLGTDAASQATQLALMDRLGADLTATQVALSDNPTWYADKPIYLDSGVVDNPQGRFITLIQEAQMDELIGSQYK